MGSFSNLVDRIMGRTKPKLKEAAVGEKTSMPTAKPAVKKPGQIASKPAKKPVKTFSNKPKG